MDEFDSDMMEMEDSEMIEIEEDLDNEEIDLAEAGFMQGYIRACTEED